MSKTTSKRLYLALGLRYGDFSNLARFRAQNGHISVGNQFQRLKLTPKISPNALLSKTASEVNLDALGLRYGDFKFSELKMAISRFEGKI